MRTFLLIAATALVCLPAGFTVGLFSAKSPEIPVVPRPAENPADTPAETPVASQTPKDPADALADAREAYRHFLRTRAMYQSDMTVATQEAAKLADMEILWLDFEICRLPNWHGVEFDEEKYWKERDAWEAKYKEAMARPSDFEGGSGEPADRALRSTKLQEERIAELRKFRELKLKEKKYTYFIGKGRVEEDSAN